jgi:hypothetical protein
VQERVAAHDGAELLGPIIAGDPSGQRKQSLSVASSKNHAPSVVEGITPS